MLWFPTTVRSARWSNSGAFGLVRFDLAGWSYGGHVALAFALEYPRRVRTLTVIEPNTVWILREMGYDPEAVASLALLEPVLLAVPSPPQVPQALERYRAGDRAGAVDLFLQGTCGPGYRAPLGQAVPGAVDQAVADAATFFEQELPALRQWAFGPADARRLGAPVLAVVGERSGPIHRQRWDLLRAWVPQAEPFVLPGAGHLLHLQQPRDMADALAGFFARHPLAG